MNRFMFIAIVMLSANRPLSAQTFDWNKTAGGAFSTAGNWTPAGPPGTIALARFNLANTYTVTFSGGVNNAQFAVYQGTVTWALGGFTYNITGFPNDIGVGGVPASLDVQSGTVNVAGLSIGNLAGAAGTLTVDSSAVFNATGTSITVGGGGTGTALVQNAGQLSSGQSYIGGNAGGSGTVTVTGSGSKWTLSDFLRVGDFGSGTLTVSSGGVVSATSLVIAQQTNSGGTLTVTGGNSSVTASAGLTVGLAGSATMNVVAGGKVTTTTFNLGGFQGSLAAATVSGVGSTLTVNNGATLGGLSNSTPANSAVLVVGTGAAVNFNGATTLQSTAIVNVNGGTLNLGTLTVQPGAALNWTTGTVRFADGGSVTGPLLNQLLANTSTIAAGQTLAATAGTLALGSPLVVAGNGAITPSALTTTASLSINTLGVVSASDTVTLGTGTVTQVADLGTLSATNGVTNNGTLQLNGPSAAVNAFVANLGTLQGSGRLNNGLSNGTTGTIRAETDDDLVVDGVGPTNLGNIELSGGTIEFTKTLSNLGSGYISGRGEFRGSTASPGNVGLTNSGVLAFSGGTTDIRGDVQNNAGGHIVNAGGGILTFYDDVVHNGVEIRTNAGSRTVFFGAQSGAGPFTGAGTVEYAGDLRPGNSPADVTYQGDVLLDSSANLVMELGGTTPGSRYDQLTVQGSITVGGALDLMLINGFVPSVGQSFTLIDNQGAGPIIGMFAGLPEGGFLTAGGIEFQATYLGGDGNDLVITPIPEPGSLALCSMAAVGWVRFWRRRWAGSAAIGLALIVGPASATDRTWSTAAVFPGGWSIASNWVNGVPVSGDNVTFVNSSSNAAVQNIQQNFAFGTMTFAPSVTTFVVGGNSFNLSNSTINMNTSGSVTISDSITANQSDILVAGSGTGTLTLNGPITASFSGGIVIGSAAQPVGLTVVFGSSGNNYGDATYIYGGTLRLGVDNAVSPFNPISVAQGGKFDIGTTNNTSATAAGEIGIDATSSLHVGAGHSGNFYLDSFFLFGGTVTDAGLSNGITFHLKNSLAITASSGAAAPALITLANNGKLVNDSSSPAAIEVDTDVNGLGLDVNARFSNAGLNPTFIKTGAGTLRLLNTTNSANLTAQAGRLRFDATNTITSGTLTLDGGMIGYFGITASTPKTMNVTNNGGTLEVGIAATTLTLTAAITGTGDITTAGPGILVYSVPMSYAGNTYVTSGTLRAGTANVLPFASTLTVNGTGTFDLNGQALSVGYLNTLSGTLTLNGGTLNTPLANLTGAVTGPGTLAMSGPLTVMAAGALNSPVSVTLNSASLLTTGAFPVAIGSLSSILGGTVTISAGGSLAIGLDNTNTTFPGTIQGSGTLTKVGTGTLTLTGSNTFTGGLTVNGGTLAFAGDTSLGPAGSIVVVNPAGMLAPSNNVTTVRTYALNGGTLLTTPGVTLTLNGATVNGGFLRGYGTFAVTGAAALNGATTFAGTTISQIGTGSYLNFTNGGTLSLGVGLPPILMNGFYNRGGGQITIGDSSQVNVADFESDGVVTLTPSTSHQITLMTNIGLSPLNFDGGSRTFIGTVGGNGQAQLELNGQNAIVAGGLLVNNGKVTDSSAAGTATIIADYGALVKGAGIYDNSPVTRNGGKFQSGNSPGVATVGRFVFGPGGVDNYVFAIDDATGTAGPKPDSAGHVSGWGLVNTVQFERAAGPTSGDFVWTADPTHELTFALETLINPTTIGTDVPGSMADFDPNQSYTWPAVQWTGNYSGPTDAATLDAATDFDTSGFANPINGTFGWSLGSSSLSLSYTPSAVPEPGSLALVSVVTAGWLLRRFRRTATGP